MVLKRKAIGEGRTLGLGGEQGRRVGRGSDARRLGLGGISLFRQQLGLDEDTRVLVASSIKCGPYLPVRRKYIKVLGQGALWA